MSSNWAISVDQYANYAMQVTWLQGGVAVNITGYSFALDAKDNNGNLIVRLSTANGDITIPTPLAGVFLLSLTAAQTTALPPGVYQYDLISTSPTNTVNRLLFGSFTVSAGVTPS